MNQFRISVWVYQGDGRPGDEPHNYEREYARNAAELNLKIIEVTERCQRHARAIQRVEVEYIGA
jgi:hypothetical protein